MAMEIEMTEKLQISSGQVSRISDNDFGYIYIKDAAQTISFVSADVSGHAGRNFGEMGIRVGDQVHIRESDGNHIITVSDRQAPAVARASSIFDFFRKEHSSVHADRDPPDADDEAAENLQAEIKSGLQSLLHLDPGHAASDSINIPHALPIETRKFGKVLNTSGLLPGDLLLSSATVPTGISEKIYRVQHQGGYVPLDAIWTHAAMYLGDGENVVEADYVSHLKGGTVKISSIYDYCQGDYRLRFRRPKHLSSDVERWKLCINALRKLRESYDIMAAAKIWYEVTFGGKNFHDDGDRHPVSDAVLCSTLYADAYNRATRRTLGEVSGICVPAWLNRSNDFDDIAVGWLSIRS